MPAALKHWTAETPRLVYELLQKSHDDDDDVLSSPSVTQELIRLLISQLVASEGHSMPAQQLYVIRCLGNLATVPRASSLVLANIVKVPETFLGAVNALLLLDDVVCKETIWCLGNVLKLAEAGAEMGVVEGGEFIELVAKRLVVAKTPGYEFREFVEQQLQRGQEMEG